MWKRSAQTMRKPLILILVMILILSSAAAVLAEKGLSVSCSPEGTEYILALRIAELLELPLLASESETPGSAANRMLADPECVLFASQDALIAGLQGYTDEDLRKAMLPVCSLAVDSLFLVMDKDVANEYGVTDFDSLYAYIKENEYDLTFARHMGADPVDRAVIRLTDELAVFAEYYRETEIPEVLCSGEAAAAVFTAAELAENPDEWLILLCLDADRSQAFADVPCAAEAGLTPCEGEILGLFLSAEAEEETAVRVRNAVLQLQQEDLPAGYTLNLTDGDTFSATVKNLFEDYKEYMTSEGLFFYEE